MKSLFFCLLLFCLPVWVYGQKSWEKLNEEGTLLYQEGKYKEAIPVFEKIKIQAEKKFGKKHIGYTNVCYNLAVLYKMEGLYDKAEILYTEVKNITETITGKLHTDYATECNNLANFYYEQNLYAKVEPLYIEVKNIREKVLGKEHPDYITSCNNLALLYDNQGKYAQAELLYIEVKNIREKVLGKEHPDYAVSCNALALLYKEQGLYAKAEFLYIEAKNIYEKKTGKQNFDYATVCNNLAVLYRSQGKYDEAIRLCIEAKNIREKVLGKEHIDYAQSCNNLANLYKKKDGYVQAELLYVEALKIHEKLLGKEHPDYAISCNNLALLYVSQSKYSEAELLYVEALKIHEKLLGKEHPNYAMSCRNLGILYYNQNRYTEAEALYIEAKNIQEKTLGKQHSDYALSCNNLALLYENQGKYVEAEPLFVEGNQALLAQIDKNFSNLSEKEKGQYYQTFNSHLKKFNSFVIKRYKQNPTIAGEAYNNSLATKALLFDASNKIRERILTSNDGTLKKIFLDWKNKKEYIAKVYQMSIADKQKQGIDVGKLETEANAIEKQLASQSEVFAKESDKKSYTWQDIQKTLKQGEAAIEIIRFNVYDKKWTDTVRYMVLIVKPESQYPEMIVLENGNELEGKYANYYQNAIKFQKKDKYSYLQYWAKIEAKLQGVKKVFLSVDGIYNSLNINTIIHPTTEKYLLDSLEIVLLTNTKDLVIAKNEQKPIREAVLIGFPDYNNSLHETLIKDTLSIFNNAIKLDTSQRFFDGSNITELLGTKVEVENLAGIMKKAGVQTQSYTGEQASEGTVKKLNNPQVLHIATHGFFLKDVEISKDDERGFMGMDTKKAAENPLLRSGLLFANAKNALKDGGEGVFTAYEAMNLDLDNTDLVVLSACETGLGEIQNGEGVYGLQRAFQQAGAKTILMSLWTVSDNATQELMVIFYENWLVKKMSKRDAFKAAQTELRKKYPAPYYWGAFVMVGE
jgi:CHAT domain-containing protein